MDANKPTPNNKDFPRFKSQVDALDAFIQLTTACLSINNPRVDAEKDNIYSTLVSLNMVFPGFFEEVTTYDGLQIDDKQEAIINKLKEIQLAIEDDINLLKGTVNFEKVELTTTNYGWWKSFLDELVNGAS